MPVIKKTPMEVQLALLRGNINKYMDAYQVTDKQMGLLLGINPGTFNQKKNHPERFTFTELVTVFSKLRFPESEILEVMKKKC